MSLISSLAAAAAQGTAPATDLPTVIVDRDNTRVASSCRLAFAGDFIGDDDGNGVVQVVGDGIVVDLGGARLRGAPAGSPPDSLAGRGIVVTGKNVTLRNGAVSGFRAGVVATNCDGSTFEQLDLSGNYAMRLLSTPKEEDGADWLWPHKNDNREWVTRYGAGLAIERSTGVTVRDVVVRGTQNGLILDRVTKSKIYDNDCSFLSGWGLAMWRSSDNVIARNAFDFCVRGYSHGVYSRGQDSAGILMFEQCSRNTIALNSATHCGDGVFGFCGREALGEDPPPADAAADFYKRRGSNDNKFFGNDFSFAAAHGFEMTFSFGNVLELNRFEGNALAGVWGGYSQEMRVAFNTFAKNGGPVGPGEGGGVDIEHGSKNVIVGNDFTDEAGAVELWWDDDANLLNLAGVKANGAASRDNVVAKNTFTRCGIGIQLRGTTDTIEFGNTFVDTKTPMVVDEKSTTKSGPPPTVGEPPVLADLVRDLPGTKTPVGARASLGGREAIRMLAFGPWDGVTPTLYLARATPARAWWRLVGATTQKGSMLYGGGPLRVNPTSQPFEFRVDAEQSGFVMPYEILVEHDKGQTTERGCIMLADWRVSFFPSPCDPRVDHDTWRAGATSAESVVIETPFIDFKFGDEGPSSLKPDGEASDLLAASHLPRDGFGTIAVARAEFPKGRYVLRVVADDGVRVKVDGKTVIDDWDRHTAREARAEVVIPERKEVEVEIEHFDIDGPATLTFYIDGQSDFLNRVRPLH
ncbi:MAG: NosD domain-containing protein [Phycisphaerales bacterium]